MYGDTVAEARASIKRSDEARAAYYKNISGFTWGDRHNYHFCIDSSVGNDNCADIICGYLQCALRPGMGANPTRPKDVYNKLKQVSRISHHV